MGFLSKIFGKKPKVPEFVPVDYDKEYDAAADYNEKNIERFGGISRKAQEQDQQALTQGLRTAIPNYDDLLAAEFDITSSLLRGELSKREQDRLRDRRAALGLSTGTQDSDLTQYSYARDLGLAERDLINQGMAYADNRIRRQSAFVAQPVSVTSMFQSPQQRIEQKMMERDSKFKRDYAANKVAAAPDPRWVGVTNAVATAMGAGPVAGGGGGGVAASLGGIGKAIGGFLGGMGGGGMPSPTFGGYAGFNSAGQSMTFSNPSMAMPSYTLAGSGTNISGMSYQSSGANFGNKPFGMR